MSQKPETPGRHTPASLNTCDIDDAKEIVTGGVDTSRRHPEAIFLCPVHPHAPMNDTFGSDVVWQRAVTYLKDHLDESEFEEWRNLVVNEETSAIRSNDLALYESRKAGEDARRKNELAERHGLGAVHDYTLEHVEEMVEELLAEQLMFDHSRPVEGFPAEVIEDLTIHKFASAFVEVMPRITEEVVLATVLFGAASGCVTHHGTKWRATPTFSGYGNVWAAVAAVTGDGKSPAFSNVMSVLEELEANRMEQWNEAARYHKVELEHAHDQVATLRAEAKKNGMTPELKAQLVERDREIEELTPKATKLPRLITSDTTPQKLVDDCAVTGSKSLSTDEAGPIRGGFDRYGDGDDIDAWLKSYDGGAFSQGRISGDRNADRLLCHVFVMPQPYALARFETDPDNQASGLSQRVLSVRPSRLERRRKVKDKTGPTAELREHFLHVLRQRLIAPPAHTEYRYSDAANEILADFNDDDQWNDRWELGGDLHPIEFYRSKIDGSMRRLGLVLHILNGHANDVEIGADTARYLLKLATYLAGQKRDIHANARRDVIEQGAVAIMQWLLSKYNDDTNDPPQGLEFDDSGDAVFSLTPISKNDVLTSVAGDSSRSTVAEAVEHAVADGWLRFEEEPPSDWKTRKRLRVKLRAVEPVLTAEDAPWAIQSPSIH